MAASFLSGDVVKMLKDQIEMVSGYKLMFGGSNPTAFALDAEKGSVYISDSSGKMYLKQDDGLSTNWEELALYSTVVSNITTIANNLYTQIESAKGTRLVSADIATITDGGLTVTSPAYKAHFVDHATNTLTVAEKTTPTVITPPNYTEPLWYVYVTAANTIQFETTEVSPSASRTLVPLGTIITNGTIIVAFNNGTRGSYRDFNGFIQDFSKAFPPKSMEGNVITLTGFPNAGGALLNKTSGLIFTPGSNVVGSSSGSEGAYQSPNFLPYASITNDMQGAGGVGFVNFQSARLSGASYDVNGVLTSTGNNNWTIRGIYIGQGGLVVATLGQTRYTSLTNARNALGAESNNFNPNLAGLMHAGWALCRGNNQEFVFVPNASNYGSGSPSVSLNLWSTRTLTSADSPFTVTGNKTIYVCDTSAGSIDIVLPTIDSSIASDENRFVKAASANYVKIRVNGGVQTIGGKTEQYIWEDDASFSVVASDLLEYLITQDSRKENTFKTPDIVWGRTASIEHIDLASSTLGTGATITGNNHSFTLTTGTTASTIYGKEVSTEELIEDSNFFSFLATISDSGIFEAKVQGWDGAAWVDRGALVAPMEAGTLKKGLIPFAKGTDTKWRLVLTNTGTTAGLTCTIARGEWTDSYWKEVQINQDSVFSNYSGANMLTTTGVIRFADAGFTSTENDYFKYTSSDGRFTAKKKHKFNIASGLTITSAAQTFDINHYNSSGTLLRVYRSSTTPAATVYRAISSAFIEMGAGDYVTITTLATLSNHATDYISITATPIGSSTGVVAQADMDNSIGEILISANSTAPFGFASTLNKSFGKTGADYSGDRYRKLYEYMWSLPALLVSTTASKGYRLNDATKGATWLADWDANKTIVVDLDGEHLRIGGSLAGSHVDDAFQGHKHQFPYNRDTGSEGEATLSISDNTIGNTTTNNQKIVTDGTNGTPRTADETRVKATYHYAYIRYSNEPVTMIAKQAVIKEQGIRFYGLGSSMTSTTGVLRWGTLEKTGDDLLTYDNATGYFKATQDCIVHSDISTRSSSTNTTNIYINSQQAGRTVTQSNNHGSCSGGGLLKKDELTYFSSSGTLDGANYQYMTITATAIETGTISTSKQEIHKHATYLSSNETEAGFCEFTGKQIWKKSFRWTGSSSATITVAAAGSIPAGSSKKSFDITWTVSDGRTFTGSCNWIISSSAVLPTIASDGSVLISMNGTGLPTIVGVSATVHYTKP